MKITVFNGSPRGEKSNTHIMVEAFLSGAKEAGAEVENIFLIQEKIHNCMGCFTCWIKTPGKCVFNDDMAKLMEKYKSTDIVVFAMPLYVDNVTGLMKNFMDRLVPLGDPHFAKDEGGECRHFERFSGEAPKIVVISNCGFPEQSHFQTLRLLFKRIARNMNTSVIAEIYRGEGELLKNAYGELKPIIENYKDLLKQAGKEAVKNMGLSDETISKLEKPLVPEEMYIDNANKYWDEMLSKVKS